MLKLEITLGCCCALLLNGVPILAADVRLDPSVLQDVQDRTRGIREEERDAYFQTLEHAAKADYEQQQNLARKNLAAFEKDFELKQAQAVAKNPSQPRYRYSLYAHLLKQSEQYRGKLITLRGHIRRLEEMPLADGDGDAGVAYQSYLFTDDSRTHPYIIVSRNVPDGIPRGGDLNEEVALTGYFFKIYAYDAQDTARVAPLIITGRLQWFPRAPVKPLMNPLTGAFIAIGALLILIVLLWRITAGDRRARQARQEKMAKLAGPIPFDIDLETPPQDSLKNQHHP